MDCYTNNFPGLPRLKKLATDKHVITELPLVPFVIINLTSLTAGVCMKVRFKSKVTRGFSFSPLRDSHSPLRGSLMRGKFKKSRWDQGTLYLEYSIKILQWLNNKIWKIIKNHGWNNYVRLVDRSHKHLWDEEKNDTDASKPVALHFNLPNHSHHIICSLWAILTPGEHRKLQKSWTKVYLSTGYTLSTQDQWMPLIPLIYSQIHVTIFPPMEKLLHTLI